MILAMILKIFTKVKFQKAVYQFFHLRELGKFLTKFKFQKKILPNYHRQLNQMLTLKLQVRLKKVRLKKVRLKKVMMYL